MYRQYLLMLCFIVVVLISGCEINKSSPSESSQIQSDIPTEITTASYSHPEEMHLTLASGLRIDEFALQEAPQAEPLTFVPLVGSQQEILDRHKEKRTNTWEHVASFVDGQFSMSVDFGDMELVARDVIIEGENQNARISIEVLLGDEVLYNIHAGDISPLNPLQGLWSYDGHWAVEVARVSNSFNEDLKEYVWHSLGQIIVDGENLTQRHGYQEAFGFQLLNQKPFYFFSRDGEIGFSYDDEETSLGYGSIYHYACCSAAELNPKPAQNMVSFFTQKAGQWYYVELGKFE